MNSEMVIKSKFNLESTPSVDQKTVDEEYDVGDYGDDKRFIGSVIYSNDQEQLYVKSPFKYGKMIKPSRISYSSNSEIRRKPIEAPV